MLGSLEPVTIVRSQAPKPTRAEIEAKRRIEAIQTRKRSLKSAKTILLVSSVVCSGNGFFFVVFFVFCFVCVFSVLSFLLSLLFCLLLLFCFLIGNTASAFQLASIIFLCLSLSSTRWVENRIRQREIDLGLFLVECIFSLSLSLSFFPIYPCMFVRYVLAVSCVWLWNRYFCCYNFHCVLLYIVAEGRGKESISSYCSFLETRCSLGGSLRSLCTYRSAVLAFLVGLSLSPCLSVSLFPLSWIGA